MTENTNFKDLLEKVEKVKKGEVDLSTEEDLALAIMNLISLEEHLYFTGAKTGKEDYWAMLNDVREMRKSLLARMIPFNEGETWCTCKHLLSTTMRLIEVGTKLFSDGKKDEAREMYNNAHKTFSLFWALRLKLIDISHLKGTVKEEGSMTLQDIMDKLVDCCKE